MDKSFAMRAHDLFTLTTDLQPVISQGDKSVTVRGDSL